MNQVKKAVHYWCKDTLSGKYQGQGVGVAVLDTGIVMHDDFYGRVRKFYDAVSYIDKIYDDNGHGTHVG
ncbi:MAG: S8 family serine peptidase [Lachnospiraceae bacterium]